MIKNIKKGLVTTVIGLVVIGAAIASVFLSSSMSWFDASIGIGIGLALLFTPDTIISRVSDLFSKKDQSCQHHVPTEDAQLPE